MFFIMCIYIRDELLESKRETEMQKDARLKLEENFSKIIQANYEVSMNVSYIFLRDYLFSRI